MRRRSRDLIKTGPDLLYGHKYWYPVFNNDLLPSMVICNKDKDNALRHSFDPDKEHVLFVIYS